MAFTGRLSRFALAFLCALALPVGALAQRGEPIADPSDPVLVEPLVVPEPCAEPVDALVPPAVRAEENAAPTERPQDSTPGLDLRARDTTLHTGFGLGFAAGATSGVGIGYRHHFGNRLGLQIAGIGFGDSQMVFGNVGANVMYTFARAWLARFYAVAGSMAVYNGGLVWDDSACIPVRPVDERDPAEPVDWQTCAKESWEHRYTTTLGAGIGIEFHFTRNIGLALELPVSVWLSFDRNGLVLDETRVWPVPNGSLVYYF
jgi:hypothetical protein